jgi:antitoxin component YwqK of YwqJK toxin-antitoxin module
MLTVMFQIATRTIAMQREPARPLLDVAPTGEAVMLYTGTDQVFIRHDTVEMAMPDGSVKVVPHGQYAMWHPNGTKATIGTYCKNQRHGEWNRFRPDGTLRNWEVWDHGTVIAKGR